MFSKDRNFAEELSKQKTDLLIAERAREISMSVKTVALHPSSKKIILVLNKEKNSKNLRKASGWGLPGGGVRPNETPIDAARRELIEETSLAYSDFDIDDESVYGTVKRDLNNIFEFHYEFTFLVRVDPFTELKELEVDDPAEGVKEWRWASPEDIIKKGKNYYFKGEKIYNSHIRIMKKFFPIK